MYYSGIRKWRHGEAYGCSLRQWAHGQLYEIVFMISQSELRSVDNPRKLFAGQIKEARRKLRETVAADGVSQ